MFRTFFALLLLPAAALAQVTVSDEIVSDPMRPHLASPAFAVPALSMARDRAGVAIAWSMPGGANLIERVYVARLDDAGQLAGAVREIPATLPQTDALAPSIAADPSGLGFTVAWLEGPEVVYCRLDAALTPSAPVNLSPTLVAPLVRSGPNSKSVWIAAGLTLYGIAPDGAREVFGINAASDMTVATGFPQLIGSHRSKTPSGCTCPVGGGPFHGICPGNCLVYAQEAIDYVALFTAAQSRVFASVTDAQPAIASDPNNVTVAWLEGEQARGGSAKALRVPLSALDSFSSARALTLGSFAPDAGATRPAVASDGARALVVWRTLTSPGNHDIAGAVVDGDGTITPLTIAASASDERDPSVIALGHGAFLVAYDKITGSERRLAGRFVTFGRHRAVR